MFLVSFCFLPFFPISSFLFSDFTSTTFPHPQRQRLIRARVSPEEGGASGEESLGASGPWGRENGTLAKGDIRPQEGDEERGGETGGGAQHKEEEQEEEEQEEREEENAPFKPFILPGEWSLKADSSAE